MAGICWGSSSGYSDENVKHLPVTQAQHNIEAADINKDGWIDLILPNQFGDRNTIYWGSKDGFNTSNKTEIPYLSSYIHGLSVADLDGAGSLDLVFTGNYDINESWIYWGPKFGPAEKTVLNTGECYGGSAVADLNKDGLLDIVFFRGAQTSYQNIIYWGDGNRFKQNICSLVGPESRASGGLIADFNKDGNLDIFFNSYNEASPVMWGPDFSGNNATYLHGGIDHHGIAREIGNIYTREYKEYYYSSIYDAKMDIGWIETEWEANCPEGSEVRVAVRTGAHLDDFKQDIVITSASDPWIELANGQNLPEALIGCNQRYIQYRVTFEYENPVRLPSLQEVRINYEGEPIPDSESQVGDNSDPSGIPVLEVSNLGTYGGWEISLSAGSPVTVDLGVYDVKGARVKSFLNSETITGKYEIPWDGRDDLGRHLPQGVYFVRLYSAQNQETKPIVKMN